MNIEVESSPKSRTTSERTESLSLWLTVFCEIFRKVEYITYEHH